MYCVQIFSLFSHLVDVLLQSQKHHLLLRDTNERHDYWSDTVSGSVFNQYIQSHLDIMGVAASVPEALGTKTDDFLTDFTDAECSQLLQQIKHFSKDGGLVDADCIRKMSTHDMNEFDAGRPVVVRKMIDTFTKNSKEKNPKVDFIDFVKTLVAFVSPCYEHEREVQLKRM